MKPAKSALIKIRILLGMFLIEGGLAIVSAGIWLLPDSSE